MSRIRNAAIAAAVGLLALAGTASAKDTMRLE